MGTEESLFQGLSKGDPSAPIPAQRLSLLGAGLSPKPISSFFIGLPLSKILSLARQRDSEEMVDNPKKETPLSLVTI
jgi:hypothetical protein